MSLCVIGPGRVGRALARRWVEADLVFAGFHGGAAGHAEEALAFCGVGRVLETDDLRAAHRVLLAVPDSELHAVASAFAETAQSGSLWFHASGFHDLDVLEALAQRGVRTGSLHPLCPFPDAEAGYQAMPGQPAVCSGSTEVCTELGQLARHAGLTPVLLGAVDRRVYHAACVLAANGLTALCDLTTKVYRDGCGVDSEQAEVLALALMRGALETCSQKGPGTALSGPVARADVGLVKAQLEALGNCASLPSRTLDVYRSLQAHAAEMADVESEFRNLLSPREGQLGEDD